MTGGVGQNTWDTVLAPRAVAHDELTGEAMHCVHSFTGHLSHGATRLMRHLGDSSATLSQRPGINEPTLPINEPTLSINEPTLPINESARSIIDSNLPRTKSSRELGRFCALFGPKESGDEAVTSGDRDGICLFSGLKA